MIIVADIIKQGGLAIAVQADVSQQVAIDTLVEQTCIGIWRG